MIGGPGEVGAVEGIEAAAVLRLCLVHIRRELEPQRASTPLGDEWVGVGGRGAAARGGDGSRVEGDVFARSGYAIVDAARLVGTCGWRSGGKFAAWGGG